MTKTVLITGAAAGIGKATVKLFQQRGWRVAATMRSPEKSPDLAALERVICLRLDVTEEDSIKEAIAQTLSQFGSLDVVINNAGYSLTGSFAACTPEQIERQFATNVFGLMAVTRHTLPVMQQQGGGVIINIASIGGRLTFPLYSLYHSTKWAVEGFSESLQYELEPFNIRVKLVEPGPIKTDFYGRSADSGSQLDLGIYQNFSDRVMPKMQAAGVDGSPPEVVAEVIYQAATDGRKKLRYPAGKNAALLLTLRKLLPDGWFTSLIRQMLVD